MIEIGPELSQAIQVIAYCALAAVVAMAFFRAS